MGGPYKKNPKPSLRSNFKAKFFPCKRLAAEKFGFKIYSTSWNGFGFFLWSWRDLNPRPAKAFTNFLHA